MAAASSAVDLSVERIWQELDQLFNDWVGS
jgi:hypothetical protein